jgi:hypothetical protein
MSFTLVGYITEVDDKKFTLTGIDSKKWQSLNKTYWVASMFRRVSKNKKTCVTRVNSKTLFTKHGKPSTIGDMHGCYVKVFVCANKYTFSVNGTNITGWTIDAHKVNSMRFPI